MHVTDLLQLEALDLAVLWAEDDLLAREISGVTATDLADPSRFLQQGEIVLSGLVWWQDGDSRAKADRFVTALRTAGAPALLAGEETHGAVPDALVESCRAHGLALLAVPAHTSFRAITDAVYLRQWGDLSRRQDDHYALPGNVRTELSRLLAASAPLDALLDQALAHLGGPACSVVSATGRTVAVAASAAADARAAGPAGTGARTGLRVDAESSAYDAWYLRLPGGADQVPPRVLYEIADVVARHRQGRAGRDAVVRRRATELLAAIDATPAAGSDCDGESLVTPLRACGLPEQGPYRVISAVVGQRPDDATAALTEALRHLPGVRFAVGQLPDGGAAAVLHEPGAGEPDAVRRLADLWPALHACAPSRALYAGAGDPAATAADLHGSLVQARYALSAARLVRPSVEPDAAARLVTMADLTSLDALLAGIPADVRAVFSARTLGPLADESRAAHRVLLETLEAFLAHNASWARTAEAMHLHVNTVHYRVQRIEFLTGRDLSRLDHKLDLRAALICRPGR
ncbi:transcriptional regulator, PucR family protein [Streptomyces sp. AcH 505]|uniref:PucR family transcriptional regulator n=1 Tax=Streptomyces sp. AcH 505 TaxID=352211 RepID=UPI0005921670|nr:transcriptional regulator, PucR family protein [Streptomyces sp. AcH 505]